MNIEYTTLAILLLVTFVFSLVLSHLWHKSKVKSSPDFLSLANELNSTRIALESSRTLENEMRSTSIELKEKLEQSQAKERQYESQISSLNTQIGSLKESIEAEKNINKTQANKIDLNLDEISLLKSKLATIDQKMQHEIIDLQKEKEKNAQQEEVLSKNRDLIDKLNSSIATNEAQLTSLKESYTTEKSTNEKQQLRINENLELIKSLHKELATLSANNNALVEKLDTQKNEVEELRKKSLLEFENVANRLLEQKSNKFSLANKESLTQILTPLQQKIKEFETKIENSDKESVERHSSLKELVKVVSQQSEKVAKDANNLAKALKGDFKKQGNWGELILQSLLDKSGLEKDREYFLQKSERDADGGLHKPDVVIELPDSKKIIVDSKVSLVAYDQMVSAVDEEEARTFRKNHALAIKAHINGLSEKNYHTLYQIESPDFVMMFIPIDTAFSSALSEDNSLFEYAFKKNIIIVTASTLLATLKTVETIWKNDKQNRYAKEIAEEAGKMYDKFVGFTDDMEKLGNQLGTVRKTYDASMKKLTNGTGNLVRKAEKIKQLGANTTKSIPMKITDNA